ncbi:enoyl-CoA hydratase/isomerase family protein [Neomegalonema sp.]|uniref:enoyl-CoA hydratase/isomerase family protein n=1 Tax=Neomegalonema sp. TaxID=2039713 RepID=UPI00260C9614|nr:enoyl-CoA hydratase/isomerase family protein [Neomegalonema sp.]MDD2867920.1 enoyl-CoA hydratase/isomerase family protein [Neomegalonema sp.]
MSETLPCVVAEGVARLTINRPDKANAVGPRERALIRAHCAALAGRAEVRAVVLEGAGEKAFCSGADLEEVTAMAGDEDAMRAFIADWTLTTDALAALPQLTIARMERTVAGGGLALALACDLRILAAEASAFYPALRRGVIPPASDLARLTRLVGTGRAKWLLLGGRRLGGTEAQALGLVEAAPPRAGIAALEAELLAEALAAPAGHGAKLKAALNAAASGRA